MSCTEESIHWAFDWGPKWCLGSKSHQNHLVARVHLKLIAQREGARRQRTCNSTCFVGGRTVFEQESSVESFILLSRVVIVKSCEEFPKRTSGRPVNGYSSLKEINSMLFLSISRNISVNSINPFAPEFTSHLIVEMATGRAHRGPGPPRAGPVLKIQARGPYRAKTGLMIFYLRFLCALCAGRWVVTRELCIVVTCICCVLSKCTWDCITVCACDLWTRYD